MILPDILKEVASQGDLEEEREDEEAEADEQDTGQPETVVAQGETSVVENPREAGLSDSHLERPLQQAGAELWGEGLVGEVFNKSFIHMVKTTNTGWG